MRIINLTHKDLDGVVCAILIQEYARQKNFNYEVHPCTYRDIEEIYRGIPNYNGLLKEQVIVLSDISFNKEPLDIGEYSNIMLIDHHPTAHSKIKSQKLVLDGPAACKLCFDLFTDMGAKYDVKFKTLMELANDYDTFTHKYPLSKQLNYIYFYHGFKAFMQRFSQGMSLFTDMEKDHLAWKKMEIEKILAELEIQKINDKIAFVVANKEIDEVAQHIYTNLGYTYVMLYKPSAKAVSFRSRKDAKMEDLGGWLHFLGLGGGHKHAASCFVKSDDAIADLVESFVQVVGLNDK